MIQSSTSCFSHHNIFLKGNGDVYSFGYNCFGQCGTGNTTNIQTPTKIMNNPKIKSIVLGHENSFYLENDGNLYGCGRNEYGQIGIKDNKTNLLTFTFICSNVTQIFASYQLTIIQKDDGKLYWCGKWDGLNKQSDGFTEINIDNVISFSRGFDHSLFLKENGEVWVMGNNNYGQCGFEEKVGVVDVPRLLLTDPNILSISCGYTHSSFILTRGEKGNTILKCFGNNSSGELGIGNTNNTFEIETINSFPNISSVHCGGYYFTFILTRDGEVYGSGYNAHGQLGLGNNNNYSSFTKTNLQNISFITTGFYHSIFVNRNKEIFVCGYGGNYELGLGDASNKNIACKLGFDDIKLIQNNHLSFEFEVNFNFELKVENEETRKEEIKKIMKEEKPIKEMIDEIFSEKNNFGYDLSQMKFMFISSLQINEIQVDKNEIYRKIFFCGWKARENKMNVVFCLPSNNNNLVIEQKNENNNLKNTNKELQKEIEDLKTNNNQLQKELEDLNEKNKILEKEKEEKKEKEEELKKKIKENIEKINSFSPSFNLENEEKEENLFSFVDENLNKNFICGVCKKVMKDPQQCGECDRKCCEKCCKNEKFCPFECEFEEMEPLSLMKKKISNLLIKCNVDGKEMKFSEYEKHLEEHNFECKWKCGFKENKKNLVVLHETQCPIFLDHIKKEKEKYCDSLPNTFQQLFEIIEKK
eukprot:TRINITY_DN356_c0_g1_i2.p1 TRINITY_DN356_c0_g1~~TRINITY_DN356_c0_g1_i2.p1  ORF type:complete len:699 (+),score=280.58 TRINITY_DN356_c0_g1_i2:98-2194(+)